MSKKILIMAGVTGGHIFPALSIAKALSTRGAIVEWLGGRNYMESDLVPRHKIKSEFCTVKFAALEPYTPTFPI